MLDDCCLGTYFCNLRLVSGKRANEDYNQFRRIIGKRSRIGFTNPFFYDSHLFDIFDHGHHC